MRLLLGLHPGDMAWLAVIAYELSCPRGETLSQALDRRLEKAPLITEAIIIYTALHCANRLPKRLDLLVQLTALVHRRTRREAASGHLTLDGVTFD